MDKNQKPTVSSPSRRRIQNLIFLNTITGIGDNRKTIREILLKKWSSPGYELTEHEKELLEIILEDSQALIQRLRRLR